jgi:hypothetical protein
MSALSLVNIIRKARGDDIAGAAEDLVRVGGFPESVARRIATGELPMDAASVEARRIAQNYGDELYHGSTHDITEFNGQGNPGNDWGQGTYLTDNVYDASDNYAGIDGPDFQNNAMTRAEQLASLSDDPNADPNDYLRQAMRELSGSNDGVIYPVRVKQDGLLNVKDEVELPNYEAQAADELGYDYSKMDEYDEGVLYEIEERATELNWEDYDSPNQNLFGVGNDMDADMSQVESIYEGDTWQDVRDKIGPAAAETPEGDIVGAGGVVGQVMARGGATGVVDELSPGRFNMNSGEHTVIFPGSENQIRSVNAAYDPMYTGSNMMGSATVPLLGLLSSGSVGMGVLLNSLFEEAEEAQQ